MSRVQNLGTQKIKAIISAKQGVSLLFNMRHRSKGSITGSGRYSRGGASLIVTQEGYRLEMTVLNLHLFIPV